MAQPTFPLGQLVARPKARRDRQVRKLARALDRAQRAPGSADLRLATPVVHHLAEVLLDFAEDASDERGLWSTYERTNLGIFGSRLPLSATADVPDRRARIRHLLWVLYPVLAEDLGLSPRHSHLERLADCVEGFLRDEVAPSAPEHTETRQALGGPNEHGADVKRKLLWLGNSYMFRSMRARYMEENQEVGNRVTVWDDFLCQECTEWSGLGVPDLLAAVLDLPPEDRETLRSWHLRHNSAYRVLAAESGTLRLANLVCGREYRVRLEVRADAFKVGQVVFGSLVPWKGEWYWSGAQQLYDELPEDAVRDVRRSLLETTSRIVCRYWPEHEARVRERAAEIHAAALALHGDDLLHYPDGLAMAADLERELRLSWESKPERLREEARRRHDLRHDRPNMTLPDELIQHTDGVGVFLHPDEGKEIMTDFTTLLSGMKRRGNAVTEAEAATIRGVVKSTSISPLFVRRIVRDHGAESIRVAFLLDRDAPDHWLEYLLRRHKGHFYKRRFPAISLVD